MTVLKNTNPKLLDHRIALESVKTLRGANASHNAIKAKTPPKKTMRVIISFSAKNSSDKANAYTVEYARDVMNTIALILAG